MDEKVIISSKKEIEDKRLHLTEVETIHEGWGKRYHDPIDDSYWTYVKLGTDYHGGGYPVLIKEPEPSQSKLIQIVIESSDIDTIATASALLYYNERDLGFEFRAQLIDALEDYWIKNSNSSVGNKAKKIKIIINESALFDSVNLRPILGKTPDQVKEDYMFYKRIAERAKKLLDSSASP